MSLKSIFLTPKYRFKGQIFLARFSHQAAESTDKVLLVVEKQE